MYTTSDIKKGLKIEFRGEPYIVIDFQHFKPGKGNAYVWTRLKNLKTGAVLENNFKIGERIKPAPVEIKDYQFLYRSGNEFIFMDTETFEQITLNLDQIGEEASYYLKENAIVSIIFFNNQPINIDLPNFMIYEVIETEPGIKGDTVSGAYKNAIIETGLKVQVPLFIEKGDFIKIDLREGKYIEKVKLAEK